MVRVTHGTLRLSNTGGRAVIALGTRLASIFEGINGLIRELRPGVIVVERVFFAKNAVSALKLGEARGVAVLCGAIAGMEIVEYSPTEIKSVVTGYGRADKKMVARAVTQLLGCDGFETADASDALAVAMCHAYKTAGSVGASKDLAAAFAPQKRTRNMPLAKAMGVCR